MLATSRESLNIAGETVLPVPPLAVPGPGRPVKLAELALFPAVRLFAERAAQVVPGFAVTEAKMAAVAGICRRLEGLSLAIELAAARARVLSAEQIGAWLSDRLGLLTRGGRASLSRQQTLRASIEWSYELCGPAERLLWARLAVFAGGCELDAAEEICSDEHLAAEEVLELDRATVFQQESLRLREGLSSPRSTLCLEVLAWIAASGRQYERAAVLLGIAAGLWRTMGTTLDGYQHLVGFQRDCYRQARQALGEPAFEVAYHRGLELPTGDALAYALQQPGGHGTSGQLRWSPVRETQVAGLLARGCSNEQIAARLVISRRTAEGHVEHILTKLGFTSRAQVAAWISAAQPGDDAG